MISLWRALHPGGQKGNYQGFRGLAISNGGCNFWHSKLSLKKPEHLQGTALHAVTLLFYSYRISRFRNLDHLPGASVVPISQWIFKLWGSQGSLLCDLLSSFWLISRLSMLPTGCAGRLEYVCTDACGVRAGVSSPQCIQDGTRQDF